MNTERATWSVGELAAATGLTVRTLHHYDEIGLARPSRRSPAGHRQYTGADVRRLHKIVALRGFGFGLTEIGALLDSSGPDPRELLQSQLDQAADRVARATRLRDRLATVLGQFDAIFARSKAPDPSRTRFGAPNRTNGAGVLRLLSQSSVKTEGSAAGEPQGTPRYQHKCGRPSRI